MVANLKQLLGSAAAVFALAPSTASAREQLRNLSNKYGKCPASTTPPKQGYQNARCPEGHGIKASDLVKCSSGSSGTDDRTTDHDIFRNLINHVGLGDMINSIGPHCTCFIPTDLGVVNTAESLGFHSYSYDEAGAESFLKDKYDEAQLEAILLYHFSCEERYTFRDLQKKERIETLEGESMFLSEPAKATPNCDERVRLIDAYRKEKPLSWGHAKIQNKFRDLETANCVLHVTKSLSLPAAVLPGQTVTTTEPTPPVVTTTQPPGTCSAGIADGIEVEFPESCSAGISTGDIAGCCERRDLEPGAGDSCVTADGGFWIVVVDETGNNGAGFCCDPALLVDVLEDTNDCAVGVDGEDCRARRSDGVLPVRLSQQELLGVSLKYFACCGFYALELAVRDKLCPVSTTPNP